MDNITKKDQKQFDTEAKQLQAQYEALTKDEKIAYLLQEIKANAQTQKNVATAQIILINEYQKQLQNNG